MNRDQVKSLASGVMTAFVGMSLYASTQVYPLWVWAPVIVAAVVWYRIWCREETERAERQSQLEERERAERLKR